MAAFTGYPPYGTYQAPYPIYPIPPQPGAPSPAPIPHFAPHFPQPPPGYSLYALQPVKAPSPPPAPPTAPDIPTISPQIASDQLRRLIVSQLKAAQFESIKSQALHRLELEVVACKFRAVSFRLTHILLLRRQSYMRYTNEPTSTPTWPIGRCQWQRTYCLLAMTGGSR